MKWLAIVLLLALAGCVNNAPSVEQQAKDNILKSSTEIDSIVNLRLVKTGEYTYTGHFMTDGGIEYDIDVQYDGRSIQGKWRKKNVWNQYLPK